MKKTLLAKIDDVIFYESGECRLHVELFAMTTMALEKSPKSAQIVLDYIKNA